MHCKLAASEKKANTSSRGSGSFIDVLSLWRVTSPSARGTAGRCEWWQRLSCGHPFDQVQGGKSITQRSVISPRQLLEAVAYASLGRLPKELRLLAHRTIPPWELTDQSPPRTEVPYYCIPYAPVVGGVEDYDPPHVEHFEKIGVDLGEMGSIRKALCGVTVDSSSTRLYAARGL
jgi:hypothetical protein